MTAKELQERVEEALKEIGKPTWEGVFDPLSLEGFKAISSQWKIEPLQLLECEVEPDEPVIVQGGPR